ncbi:MAG: SEC-C domain-containing protein [Chloracidobacterium sp.]|nr:SEC-C domain-containing protein [Chloracidobacterium sp.]
MIEGDNEATDGRFQSMLETFRVSVAESYFELGETARTDSLYHEWLDGDPQWGAGWIEWSDHYRFTQTLARNLERAEELLKEGLSVSGVRDFDTLTERLATIQEDKQKEVEQQSTGEGVTVLPLEKTASQSEKINVIQFSARGASSRAADLNRVSSTPQSYSFGKIGRNDPCSCGSGKKFKKCCGGKM